MTNLVALRTVEEFMSDYKPIYQPIYPLFMGNSQLYNEQVGQHNFKRVNTVGDIRMKHVLPKDTEMKQIAVNEASKTFSKYFLANQFVISNLQDKKGIEDVIAQVLDEHQKQADDLFLLGEGTSASTMLNNGLFWSADSNYVFNSSAEVASGVADDHLKDFHAKIMAQVSIADEVAGRKILVIYGSTATSKYDSLYSNTDAPFKKVLTDVLGSNYSTIKLPSAVTPSGTNGIIIANADQVKLHYTSLPQLKGQGVNEEKMYTWHNFVMGSMMLDVLAYGAVRRQPFTFEA